MSYLVLARKWRPGTFDEVVGQEHVTRTLKNAIKLDRVAHALLFTGSRGVGKTSCARILAKALNCAEGPTVEPCGRCPACVEIAGGSSVDVFEIDGASNNSVDQIREIRESVKFLPTRGKRKMYIIDEVHMLTTSAFNALLKTLEEPPEHVLFVFATTEPHKIPDTILSRCQRYDFKRIPERKIVEAIGRIAGAEGVQVEPAALHHIAREAQGGMRDSLSLLDQVIAFCGTTITEAQVREVLGIADRRILQDLTRAVLAGDGQAALGIVDELFRFGLDVQKFAAEFVQHLRDLMVVKVCTDPARLVDLPEGEVEAMAELVRDVSSARIHRLFNAFLAGAEDISRSPYPKLVLEMALLRLCHQGPTLPLAEVLEGLARLEARLAAGGDGPEPTSGGAGPTGGASASAPPSPAASAPAPAPSSASGAAFDPTGPALRAAGPGSSGGSRESESAGGAEPSRASPVVGQAASEGGSPPGDAPAAGASGPPDPSPRRETGGEPAAGRAEPDEAGGGTPNPPASEAPDRSEPPATIGEGPAVDFSVPPTDFSVPPPPLPPGQAAVAAALGLLDPAAVDAAERAAVAAGAASAPAGGAPSAAAIPTETAALAVHGDRGPAGDAPPRASASAVRGDGLGGGNPAAKAEPPVAPGDAPTSTRAPAPEAPGHASTAGVGPAPPAAAGSAPATAADSPPGGTPAAAAPADPAREAAAARFEQLVTGLGPEARFVEAHLAELAVPLRLEGDEPVLAVVEAEEATVRADLDELATRARAVDGRAFAVRVEACAPGDPRLSGETLADRRRRKAREREEARREAARRHPVIQEAVSVLGAEIVSVRLPGS